MIDKEDEIAVKTRGMDFKSSSDICRCGHKKLFHYDLMSGMGTGKCKRCKCKKFKKDLRI